MVDTKTILLPLVLRMIFAAIALRIDRTRAHDTRAGMKCVTIDNVTVQVVCNTCCGNLWTREKGCPDECWDTFVKCAFCEQRGASLGGLKISLSAEVHLFSCLACLFPTPATTVRKIWDSYLSDSEYITVICPALERIDVKDWEELCKRAYEDFKLAEGTTEFRRDGGLPQ